MLDERSDIWSLGCLLFALAFHRSPFDLPDSDVGGSIGTLVCVAGIRALVHRDDVVAGWCVCVCALVGAALAVISGKYDVPSSSKYSKGLLGLIGAMLQSRLEDRPFVGVILSRVEAMLAELGVAVPADTLDSDGEDDASPRGDESGGDPRRFGLGGGRR